MINEIIKNSSKKVIKYIIWLRTNYFLVYKYVLYRIREDLISINSKDILLTKMSVDIFVREYKEDIYQEYLIYMRLKDAKL